MQKVSIVVPCYNEEDSLPHFYSEICVIAQRLSNYVFEVIFVDDGSSDKTLDVIQSLCQKDNGLCYLSLSRNFGKEAALFAGMTYAKGSYVCVMDADLQDPPSLLPKMLDYLETGE